MAREPHATQRQPALARRATLCTCRATTRHEATDQTRRYCAIVMTPEAERMAFIVREHVPLLKQAGFKKRRHCFNRLTADGLVHVVVFWMAPKEPPAWTEVPGLRERRYGSFRLNFGVYVPEMARNYTPRSDWINDFDCQLRQTIGRLMTGKDQDFWWRLDEPYASLLARDALEGYGLPWLDHFPDRDAVLAAFEGAGSLAIGLTPAGALDVADLYRAVGRGADERRTVEGYVAHPVLGTHAVYLAKYLQQHGHADLVSLIRTRE